ncbi:MAG: hypothetical protein R2763_01440 [Mycobacterium sp.]
MCRYCAHRFPTSKLKCVKFGYANKVLDSQVTFVCDLCDHNFKRRTQPDSCNSLNLPLPSFEVTASHDLLEQSDLFGLGLVTNPLASQVSG